MLPSRSVALSLLAVLLDSGLLSPLSASTPDDGGGSTIGSAIAGAVLVVIVICAGVGIVRSVRRSRDRS